MNNVKVERAPCICPSGVSISGCPVCGPVKYETVTYPCGCKASGASPLPRYCPDHGATQGEQMAKELSQYPTQGERDE